MGSATFGIDLSAQPKETAVCIVEWSDSSARVTHLSVGADNDAVVDLVGAHHPTKVAIDAPFGWLAPFIAALHDFTHSVGWPTRSERRASSSEDDRPRCEERDGRGAAQRLK